MVFGVNTFDLDLGVQVNPVKQPIKSNSVGSEHMSYRRTSSFNYHFDHGFVVFKNVQLGFTLKRKCVGGYVIHLTQLFNLLFSFDMLVLGFGIKNCPVSWWLVCLGWTLLLVERSTSTTMSPISRASNPSTRNPASREMTSDSVEM